MPRPGDATGHNPSVSIWTQTLVAWHLISFIGSTRLWAHYSVWTIAIKTSKLLKFKLFWFHFNANFSKQKDNKINWEPFLSDNKEPARGRALLFTLCSQTLRGRRGYSGEGGRPKCAAVSRTHVGWEGLYAGLWSNGLHVTGLCYCFPLQLH